MNKKGIRSIDQGFLKNVSEVLEKEMENAQTVRHCLTNSRTFRQSTLEESSI